MLLVSTASYAGAQSADPCFVCLSEEEARAAADSAVKGMEAVALNVQLQGKLASKEVEASALRRVMAINDSTQLANALIYEEDRVAHAQALVNAQRWETAARRQRPWVWVGKGAVILAIVKGGVEAYQATQE